MQEFDYSLDYKSLDFSLEKNRHLYRVGRGEQGVLIVQPYAREIGKHWKFRTLPIATQSAETIYHMFLGYKESGDFIGCDMARKFLEMGFTRARRYANHRNGRKYDKDGNILPQAEDALTCEKAQCAAIFKKIRDEVVSDKEYQRMRQEWKSK